MMNRISWGEFIPLKEIYSYWRSSRLWRNSIWRSTTQMLKIIFSLHLFATTVMTFTQIVHHFNLYIYLMRTRGDQLMSSFETQIYYKLMITFITYYFAKIGLIIWACESGKNQAMDISTTVYDVFNSISDKQIKYEVD